MIKIRLARLGAKKKPIYRVVVADVRKPHWHGSAKVLSRPTQFVLFSKKPVLWLNLKHPRNK